MKYASIDIETTGLNEQTCQILSVGVVIEDTKNILPFDKIPKLHLVLVDNSIQGELFAIDLNKDLISLIKDYSFGDFDRKLILSDIHDIVFTHKDFVVDHIIDFLSENNVEGKLTVAGKNYVGFDKKFLEKLPGWDKLNIHRRVIDPATSFVDWENDTELPDLSLCKYRAGMDNTVVKHTAIEDAFDVIEILRTQYSFNKTI